jgi:hypothetical protein
VLLGLRRPIIRFFEGYPLEDWALRYNGRTSRRQLRPSFYAYEIWSRMREWQENLYEDLQNQDDDEGTRRLDRYFAPGNLDIEPLPTRFGNALRAFEYYSESRWGLNALAAWPRIAALLSDRERDLHAEAETDLMFFVNWSVVCYALSVALAVDGVVTWSLSGLGFLPALALAYAFYRFAIGAAVIWGIEVRASIDLHRLELYERLGVTIPRSFSGERRTARLVGRFLDLGEPLPDYLRGGKTSAK